MGGKSTWMVVWWIVMAMNAVHAQPAAPGGMTETFRAVQLARGGTLPILIDKAAGSTPSIAVLLFAGYPGVLRLREENGAVAYDLAGNFLIRSRAYLVDPRIFTVMVDCPVDQWAACDDQYRTSATHAADVADVIAVLKRDAGAAHIYLAGTSYGTLSTAYLARALADKIDGAIHTASFTDPGNGRNAHALPMRGFDWSRAKTPQLLVHHRNDPCDGTRYANIAERRGDLPLITVEGGSGGHGAACQAYTAHGFVGREQAVMGAIRDWILERRVAPTVGTP